MKTTFKDFLLTLAVSVLLASNSFGQGNSVKLDFETDPEEAAPGIVFAGTSEWIDPDFSIDGNGYLKITDALNGQSGAIVMPDLSNPPGSALSSFSISADLRVGGGTASPADGFSFNLVRPDDPLAQDPPELTYSGIRGEGSLPEEGSRTGLGIGFDEWQSGPTAPGSSATDCGEFMADTDAERFDCVGISVRVDGELLGQVPFPIRNGELEDQQSLQTGPLIEGDLEERTLALGYARLVITVTPDGNNPDTRSNLSVIYKDRTVFDEVIDYRPTPGQLVFAGRTGGANANHHIDNIEITTDFDPDPLGDFNLDMVIDVTDFMILADNMNTTPGLGLQNDYQLGDVNFSGTVDLADFVAFRSLYAAAQGGGAAAVPEPSGAFLAGFVCLALAAFRRRSSR